MRALPRKPGHHRDACPPRAAAAALARRPGRSASRFGRRAAERPVGERRPPGRRRRPRRAGRGQAAAKIWADSRSPRLTTKSRVRARQLLEHGQARQQRAPARRASASISAATPAAALPSPATGGVARMPLVACAQRLRRRGRSCRRSRPRGARRQPQQQVGDAGGRRHDHDQARRAGPCTMATACRYAAPSASDAPPNLWTSTVLLRWRLICGQRRYHGMTGWASRGTPARVAGLRHGWSRGR